MIYKGCWKFRISVWEAQLGGDQALIKLPARVWCTESHNICSAPASKPIWHPNLIVRKHTDKKRCCYRNMFLLAGFLESVSSRWERNLPSLIKLIFSKFMIYLCFSLPSPLSLAVGSHNFGRWVMWGRGPSPGRTGHALYRRAFFICKVCNPIFPHLPTSLPGKGSRLSECSDFTGMYMSPHAHPLVLTTFSLVKSSN